MKITIEEARKIALLSRLEFSAEDLEKMRESMKAVILKCLKLYRRYSGGIYNSWSS